MKPGGNDSRSGRDGTGKEPHGRPAGCDPGCTGPVADAWDSAARGTATPSVYRILIATPTPSTSSHQFYVVTIQLFKHLSVVITTESLTSFFVFFWWIVKLCFGWMQILWCIDALQVILLGDHEWFRILRDSLACWCNYYWLLRILKDSSRYLCSARASMRFFEIVYAPDRWDIAGRSCPAFCVSSTTGQNPLLARLWLS